MAKLTKSSKITSINSPVFDDLENYLEFCRDYGYKFDESDLYDMKSFRFQQFSKFMTGRTPKNQWDDDTRKFALRF